MTGQARAGAPEAAGATFPNPAPVAHPDTAAPRQRRPEGSRESVAQVIVSPSAAGQGQAGTGATPRTRAPDTLGRLAPYPAPLSNPADPGLSTPMALATPDTPAPQVADTRNLPAPALPAPAEPPSAQIARRLAMAPPVPNGDTPLEMTLDPPELGSIRLSVSRGSEGMILHLQAELPETLDLLRRHGAALAEELQRHGLDHSSFTFSGGDHGHGGSGSGGLPPTDDGTDQPPAPPDAPFPPTARSQSDGLDLRL